MFKKRRAANAAHSYVKFRRDYIRCTKKLDKIEKILASHRA
jgi:hypothetical protein